MTESEIKKMVNHILNNAPTVVLSSINEKGFPESRAMLNLKQHSGDFSKIWFTTNSSSRKIQQFTDNPQGSAYFMIPEQFIGVTLFGQFSVVENLDVKREIWQPGWEMFYPLGVEDPDNAVLLFEPAEARLYHNQEKFSFEIKQSCSS